MNQDIIRGSWKELKGKVQARWGELTDDQLDKIQGNRKQLAGALQKSYGLAKDQAEREIKEWESTNAA
ncbi:MAG: CsbD family protein [Alphaproteobacteria bacterium]|nr:CsbD family protein [Alphaproteobacteria bacterium]